MKKTKCNMLVKRLEAMLCIAVLVIASIIPMKAEAAITGTKNVEEIDFSDFSNWRSGVYYYANGKYTEDSYRICLNDYVTFTSTKFKVHIADTAFRILVRELNSNKNLLRSVTLNNGQEYEPGNDTVYLAISVYKFVNGEKDMSYEVFENKFANGFVAELCAVKDTTAGMVGTTTPDTEQDIETGAEEDAEETVEDIDFTDFSNWKTGYYHYSTGKYASYSSRICLNDYVTYSNDDYVVSISQSGYQLLIREMDQNMKFIKSYNLANGKNYEPSSNAVYLGISLYKLSESGVTYSTFKNLFANGFEAKLIPVEEVEEDSIIVESPSFSIVGSTNSSANSSMSSTATKATFYDCVKESLENGDTSEVDVSAYKVTNIEFYNTIWPQIKEDCYVEYHSCRNVYPEITVQNNYVVSYKLVNVDIEYKERIKRVRASVNEFLESVDSRMSDLEKVLLAHEYIVNNTEYKLDEAICYTAGGPLGNGYGVCLGYADAMMVLLHEVDVETRLVSSDKMNHAWVYVRVDGAWYHVDPTWADTKRSAYGKYMHKFLLRNDEEFETIAADKTHYDWRCINTNESSVSTKYTDWYVHDVAGSMYYYDGMWYYWDISTNSILCSNIEGTITKVVVDGSKCDRIKLNSISGNVLSYYIGTTQYSRTL